MESRYAGVLKRKIEERRTTLLATLGSGVPSWDLYNRLVGEVQGLGNAEKLADDADYELNRGS